MRGSNSAAHTKLVKDILETCFVHGHFACPMKVGGAFVQGKDKPFFMKFGVKGMADVLCLGRRSTQGEYFFPIWFEAKTGAGEQDEFQKSFEEDVKRRGHAYIVIRDVREVDAILKRL
jgi:hypothetical protein